MISNIIKSKYIINYKCKKTKFRHILQGIMIANSNINFTALAYSSTIPKFLLPLFK